MNSIERVKAALEFNRPGRIPVINWMNLNTIFFNSDVFPIAAFPSKKWQPGWREGEEGLFPHVDGYIIGYKWKKPPWAQDPKYKNWRNMKREEIDEWGCIWVRKGDNRTMGHPGRPSLPDWSKLDEYIDMYFPDPTDKSRFAVSLFGSKIFARNKYRMVLPSMGPFTLASNMRGFTNFLVDHRRNPDKVKQLLEQITDIIIKMVKTVIKLNGKPDGFWLVDDLGTQDRPFFPTDIFRKMYKSSYGVLIKTIHDLGLDFHHHCCGKIDPLIPVLLDWGIDALELDSPRMSGYIDLKSFRGKLMFWGCINIQSIYVKGRPEDCVREVWHMIRNLGTRDGGFGAYFYPQQDQILVPKENIKAFKKGIRKFGNYSRIPDQWWITPAPDSWKANDIDIVPQLPIIDS
ncbi:MAG: uroporphyrinogen decarboxylase family protein [Candidatus Helarchaeota archaeon]